MCISRLSYLPWVAPFFYPGMNQRAAPGSLGITNGNRAPTRYLIMIGVHGLTESVSLLGFNWRHVIFLLALVLNLSLFRRSRCAQLKSRSRLYCDRNGQASLVTTAEFDQRSRRIQIFVCGVLGLAASVVSVVVDGLNLNYLSFNKAIVTLSAWVRVTAVNKDRLFFTA